MFTDINKRIKLYEKRLKALEQKLEDPALRRKRRQEIQNEHDFLKEQLGQIEASVNTFKEDFFEGFPEPKSESLEPELTEYSVENASTGINFLMIAFLLGVGFFIYWAVMNN